jgi:hypothetical protein
MKTYKLSCGSDLVVGSIIEDREVAMRRSRRLRQEAALWAFAQKGVDLDELIQIIEDGRKAGPFDGAVLRQEAIDRLSAVA